MNLYEKMKQNKTYIIAEMSANHAKSLERAKEIIYAAKKAGADCIKTQLYTPDTLTMDCNNSYFSITEGIWEGENLYQLYQKAYTPWEWMLELKETAQTVGIDFLVTPFDKTAVDFLDNIGVEFYKIASFELVDLPLLRYVAAKQKPMIISTGMATLGEIEAAVNVLKEENNNKYILLKCSSVYPAKYEELNLKTIENMEKIFKVPIGLSDHSMGSVAAIVAVALGARIVEKHFCISRSIENPDSSFSMEPDEFSKMVEDIRSTELAMGQIEYGVSESEKDNIIFRRSIFVVEDIKEGETLTEKNARIIRPGYGLEPKYFEEILGQTALCNIEKGTPLKFEMIGKGNRRERLSNG